MQQLIIGGKADDQLSTANVEYNYLCGGSTWFTNTFDKIQVISAPGIIKNLAVKLSGSPGAGKSYTIILMKNGLATSLSVLIADSATQAIDTDVAHHVAVVAGDYVALRCTPSGTPTARYATWCSIFEGTNARESLGSLGVVQANSGWIVYPSLMGGYGCLNEIEGVQVIPTGGRLKNLYVQLDVDPGTDPDAYRFTLRVNGASTALTCTITADAVTGHDTHEVVVKAGDQVCLMVEPLNAPANHVLAGFGMTFVANIEGESLLLGGSWFDTPIVATTEYNEPALGGEWSTEAASRELSMAGFVLNKFYAWISAVSSGDYTLKLRKAGADSGIAITITAGSQVGNDITHSYSTVDYEYLGISCIAAGDARHVHWGMVCKSPSVGFVQNIGIFSV